MGNNIIKCVLNLYHINDILTFCLVNLYSMFCIAENDNYGYNNIHTIRITSHLYARSKESVIELEGLIY